MSIREITHKIIAALPLLPLALVALAISAICFAQLTYAKENPYTPYLNSTRDELRQLGMCYSDAYSRDSRTYCVAEATDGYTTFSFLPTGELMSVSFWRRADLARLGDFIAWYGTPNSIQQTRYWTGYTWRRGTFRLIVEARTNDLYSRVIVVIFDFS